MDRHLTPREGLHFLREDLPDHHAVSQLGEAGGGDQPDPPGSDYPDRLPLAHLRLSRPAQVPGSWRKPSAILSMSSFGTVSMKEFEIQNEPWSVCQATIRSRSPS